MSKDAPLRIGRYEVLGQLAVGGMAELLLGRIHGPSGFERPVVIKRILPHMASEPEFRSMFLDEARIAAGVRHPNVVHVEELGQEGDDLFLVMEYLSGETMSAVMHAVSGRGDKMGRLIAAHVVSEACAGLQAAHELVDGDGNKVNLVHRDISPDNLFVTYDGQVKVIDFGIAQAEGRFTKTRTGTLKGKFSYMSPEHCRGEELDPRSDIFALGVVLFELTMHRRLFKRSNELLTLQAITQDPIPRPKDFEPDYPSALDAICARALARDRNRRYDSAREMRRDLTTALGKLNDGAPLEDQLRDLMCGLFAARIEEKSQLLKNVRLGKTIEHIPTTSITIPSGTNQEIAPPLPASRPIPVARWLWSASALLVLVVGIGTLLWVRHQATLPNSIVTIPSVTPPAPSVRLVRVALETLPSGARVRLDDADRGVTPIELVVPARATPAHLSLMLEGYAEHEESIALDVDQRVRMSLTKLAAPPEPVAHPTAPKRKKPPETQDFQLFE